MFKYNGSCPLIDIGGTTPNFEAGKFRILQ